MLLFIFIPYLSFCQIVTEDCNSIPDPGVCFAAFEIYYFNQETNQCEESIWGGCDGLVPFWSLEQCQNNCENTKICESSCSKEIVKIIDILGRENSNKFLQLYIYEDGTIEKKLILNNEYINL